jgi:hypothetical protein
VKTPVGAPALAAVPCPLPGLARPYLVWPLVLPNPVFSNPLPDPARTPAPCPTLPAPYPLPPCPALPCLAARSQSGPVPVFGIRLSGPVPGLKIRLSGPVPPRQLKRGTVVGRTDKRTQHLGEALPTMS